MIKSPIKTVSIAAGPDTIQAPLSKGQKAFNRLIKQIENGRTQLAAWEAVIPRYQQKYASEMAPLIDASAELQVAMVHCLDRACEKKGLTKTERHLIANLITGMAGGLLAERDDAALKAIYNKHGKTDYDKEAAADFAGLKSVLEDALGVELGDDLDMRSPEEMLSRAKAKMQEAQAQSDADRLAYEERRAKKKKSAKQLAKEAQQQADEQQTSLSIREVYRKLVSALHPDRENDPQERGRKTALMQRVNQAYDKKNLLQLLELQLELEHIDQSAIDNMSEDRLRHFNKVLKEQLAELEQEVMHVEGRFRMQFNISPFANVAPGTAMRKLDLDIVEIEQGMRHLKADLLAFEDIKRVKSWLKDMRQQARSDEFYDVPF